MIVTVVSGWSADWDPAYFDLAREFAARAPLAAMLGIGVTKLYELIKAGEVQTVKLGKVTLIPLSSLEAVVARHRMDR